MAASMDVLGLLHKTLATQLLKMLEEGVPVSHVDKEGNETITMRSPTAAELGVAVAFLKNNNVTSSIDDNDELKALAEKLRAGSKSGKTIKPVTDLSDGEGIQWQ